MAESNGLWLSHLRTDCLYTAGSAVAAKLGNEYGKSFAFQSRLSHAASSDLSSHVAVRP